MQPRAVLPRALLIATALVSAPAYAEDSGELLLDATVGIPRLESSDLRIAADLLFGWSTDHFLVSAHGGVSFFDFDDGAAILSRNLRTGGVLDGGYLGGEPTDFARFEVRASAGYTYLDTQFIDLGPNPSNGLFNKHHSNLIRGLGLVGGRLGGQGWTAQLLAGAGVQVELYSDLRVAEEITTTQTTKVTVHAEVRFFARTEFWSEVLAAHASVLAQRFEVTRDALGVTLTTMGGTMVAATAIDSQEIDVSSRIGLDVVVLEFVGFQPTVWFGLDFISITSEVGDRSTLIPMIGVGLVRRGTWD